MKGQSRYVGRESWRLVASVELVEPYALEEVVLDRVVRRRLVEATELDIRGHASRDVEHIVRSVRPRRYGEQGVADNTCG